MSIKKALTAHFVIGYGAAMTETGRTLRALRHDAGLSIRAMAEQIGISYAFLCDIELGHRRLPQRWLARLPEGMKEPIRVALRADVVTEAENKLARLG